MSALESYKALGYKKYTVIAELDGRTSVICREMNREVFNIEDFQPGVTAPPFHANCRSDTAPYVEKDDGAAGPGMVRDPKTGELTAVPRDMSYKEWYAERVKDTGPRSETVYEKKQSEVDWTKIINVPIEASEALNAAHTELNALAVDSGIEKAILLSRADGKKLYELLGEKDEVALDAKIISLLKKSPDNSLIFTHNHPSSTTFSSNDFAKIIEYKSIQAMTLECVDGSKYVLERGKLKSSFADKFGFYSVFNKIYYDVASKYPELENTDTIDEVWSAFYSAYIKALAKRFGVIFRRVN